MYETEPGGTSNPLLTEGEFKPVSRGNPPARRIHSLREQIVGVHR
jgi:hypothetical protein